MLFSFWREGSAFGTLHAFGEKGKRRRSHMEKRIRLDTVLSFDITADKALPILYREISSRYPDYRIEITPDLDTAD